MSLPNVTAGKRTSTPGRTRSIRGCDAVMHEDDTALLCAGAHRRAGEIERDTTLKVEAALTLPEGPQLHAPVISLASRASSFMRATSASIESNFSSPRIQPTKATSTSLP